MQGQRTKILLLVAILAVAAACVAFVRLDKARSAALAAGTDLAAVHRDLADIAKANSGGPLIAIGQLDPAELARRLTSAAVDARVLEHLVDTDPGTPARLGNSDYNERVLMLRFDKITLRELTVFFDRLATADPGSRVKSIELASPEALLGTTTANSDPGDGEEKWTAFVGVAYLMHAPR